MDGRVFWNRTSQILLNESWDNECNDHDLFYYNFVRLTETTILPSLIGILCSTGLVGNILVLVTILRYVSPRSTGHTVESKLFQHNLSTHCDAALVDLEKKS